MIAGFAQFRPVLFGLSLALVFAACVPIPFRSERTGAVKGRMTDAASRAPLAGARVEFLDYDKVPLRYPHAASDTAGFFSMPRSYTYHLFAHPAAHAMAGWPPPNEGHFLRFSLPPYRPRILDLDAIGQAQHLKSEFGPRFNSAFYEGTITLGEVTLAR